jgi:hypothetical protein
MNTASVSTLLNSRASNCRWAARKSADGATSSAQACRYSQTVKAAVHRGAARRPPGHSVVIFGGIWQGIFGIILHARVRVISKAVTPIDECHLPGTICHQDPRRCAEGMNGLVKVGCPATTTLGTRSGAHNHLGTGDTCRWETAADARVAAYLG